MRQLYSLLILLLLLAGVARAQAPSCDADKSCVGNALTIEVTRGKGAQYVDVDTSAALRSLDTAMTFEAWIKPSPQPGKRQFVAGLWGPNRDNNDQWVVYIDDDRISFALSAPGSRLGDVDNTVASATVPNLYTRGWTHIAAAWDGVSTAARLYVDGIEVARTTNPSYPIQRLHRIERALPMQIGSCNILFDDTLNYRAFKGQIDEIRLWKRALTPLEIRCQHNQSLAGNEAGLVLYYRCNLPNTAQDLCDATRNNIVGRMRSGAHCDRSDRVVPATFLVTPATITRQLDCIGYDTLTFSIVDTSFCGSRVNLAIAGRDASTFRVSPSSLVLSQNIPATFQVFADAKTIGAISASVRIRNVNACGDPVNVPLNYNRKTDLSYSRTRILLDTLFVGCTERTFEEDTIQICNTTGSPRTISGIGPLDTSFTWRPESRPLPVTLAPNECWTVIVRMNATDTTRTNRDTLRVLSDDRCPGSGIIPLEGHTQDVLGILTPDARSVVRRLNFEAVCPGQLSDVRLYQYRNLVGEEIELDSIVATTDFVVRRIVFPLRLRPNFAYQPEFVRSRPSRPGPLTGEVRFYLRFRGCTIVRKIDLSGSGISVDVDFQNGGIFFGNVTIGKSRQLDDTARNNGNDPRRMSSYLKIGDVFRIVAGRTFNIAPGGRQPVAVEFRPREPITYYDTLCIFDEQCYADTCIPISGTGVFEALQFEPPYMALENAAGCQCLTDTITVRNITSAGVTVTSAALNDGTGKFRIVGPSSGALAPNGTFDYIVTYCPNDLNLDRADAAYIDIVLSDGQRYQILLRGTSVVPRLYVTPLTTYGPVEVGWSKTDRILVENVSVLPITITAPPALPPGYSIVSINPPLPVTLNPRDSLWVEVQLAPTTAGPHNGKITFTLDSPCRTTQSGDITGSGEIVELKVPESLINYGLVKPCDCPIRKISLPNTSEFVPITIDSIWIDGAGVTSPRPAVFSWRSQQTGGSTLPYQIAPKTTDTLLIAFCPDIPATNATLLSNATLHIKASTPGWTKEFLTTLSGRREMNFTPNRSLVQFSYTRVDRDTAIDVEITVPGPFTNPSGDSVVIDSISFNPDQRVFWAEAASGQPLPWVIKRGEKFIVRVHFRPRAPRLYIARMNLHTSFPCVGIDTTILVRGEGFAPSAGLQMAFDTAAIGRDTMRLTTCDTLDLPVMIDRGIPQDIIDILFRIGYDSTMLKLIDARSAYTSDVTAIDSGNGVRVRMKNARSVGKGTIVNLRFAVLDGPASFTIQLDQIDFDSDSLVFFKIVPTPDSGIVIIDRPMIAITKVTSFDTVNLRSCGDRQIVVSNPGRIPIRFDSLGGLPPGHRVIASSIPYPDTLAPGESITLTVRFCPFIEGLYDTLITARSNWPCPIADTGRVTSFGYAPPFPFRFAFDANIGVVDTIGGAITDTVEVPVMIDRDIPQTPLDIDFTLAYNRRALQFLGVTSPYATPQATEGGEGVRVQLDGCDSIRQGELVRFRFAVAVPDSIVSMLHLDTHRVAFASDSIFWVKLIPTGDTSMVRVDPKCNITRLNFRGGVNKMSLPTPNPTSGAMAIEVEFIEDAHARVRIYNSAGAEVARLLDERLTGGRYRLELDARELAAGTYYCILEAGRFRATRAFVVVK